MLELIVGVTTFWSETGARFRAANPRTSNKKGGRTREALSDRVTWLLSLFLLGYVGIEGLSSSRRHILLFAANFFSA